MTDVVSALSILAVNGGSSTIKFALFAEDDAEHLRGVATGTQTPTATLTISTARDAWSSRVEIANAPLPALVERIIAATESECHATRLGCIVHRVVHGGERFNRAQCVTAEVMTALRELIPLAPNHLPDEIALIEAFMAAKPDVLQIVCFDTAFHHDLPAVSHTLPVPATAGLRRYGFHGLSYAFLLAELERLGGNEALGRVVLAHLGSGASVAALVGGRCVDTSMGLTPTGGLVMSTRSGDLDPGVIAYLARRHGWSLDRVDEALTHESGLFAISGGTADMKPLLALEASDPRARLAVDVFCYQIRKWIGAFAAALGGLDTLVFSGGIGEHAPIVRSRICKDLAFLGVQLDDEHNTVNAPTISDPAARVRVRVIPTNEAVMMSREARELLREARAAT